MKIRAIIKGVISYILALMLAVIFALYLNANVGWFMLTALILALILSVFFAWLTTKTLKVAFKMEEAVLHKGDWCEMEVTVENCSIFPTTPIEFNILNGDGVKCSDKNILVSVMPKSRKTFTIRYEAKICGMSTVGIEDVKVTDYLGIKSIKLKKLDYKHMKKNISVIPNISSISLKNDKILKIMQASLSEEDCEDTVESSNTLFGGFPGYDNREYVPGDPLKRINWKQSVKRGKLLVRLDDEMATKSVNIVLDSVYYKEKLDIKELSKYNRFRYCPKDEIIPSIAEECVENTLGIIKALVSSDYTVNFYVYRQFMFEKYIIEDEKDVENIRIAMADYNFVSGEMISRLPDKDKLPADSNFVFCTPNSEEDSYMVAEDNIFSAIDDIKKNNNDEDHIFINDVKNEKVNYIKKFINENIIPLVIPGLLALSLSVTLFNAFKVPLFSFWTILQALVCIIIFALCNYVSRHKLVGTMILTVMVMGIFSSFTDIVSEGEGYLEWFMSGSDVVENTASYLMSLILIFTVFFSMVIYYYTQRKYRTSSLFLISMIPFVFYVKIMRDIEIEYVMLIIILNVAAFLVNTRRKRDKGKRIVAYKTGIISVLLYAVFFVLVALAVPKSDKTKYYNLFEEVFLGGNTSIELPAQYGIKNQYSGNADDFNKLNNRKLYTIKGDTIISPLYMKRQVFDYYDYQMNRWYMDSYYEETNWLFEISEQKKNLSVEKLAGVMIRAEQYTPGFLEKYGLEKLKENDFTELRPVIYVRAENYANYCYIAPTRAVSVSGNTILGSKVTKNGIWLDEDGLVEQDASYDVEFYEDYINRETWIGLNGANFDNEKSYAMLQELVDIVDKNGEFEDISILSSFIYELKDAQAYEKKCSESNKDIPKKVKDLALDITKDCTYDWEKAEALQNYFRDAGFVYDLEYDAPDDSVEYFLFEGKTGTCSDFASAYVLMARAAGLIVRYVEGFVPEEEVSMEEENCYVVRTNCAHAYPEVYIQNYGFTVYEPTVSGMVMAQDEGGIQSETAEFVLTLGYRLIIIFTLVSAVIIILLIIIKFLTPTVKEKYFIHKVRKSEPDKGVIMLYGRIINKFMSKGIKDADICTPYEFAVRFEAVTKYDISPLTYMVEKTSYEGVKLSKTEKEKALKIYGEVKKM